MMPCGAAGAHPVLCLDVCGGYAGRLAGYDSFLYRYYFAGAVGSGAEFVAVIYPAVLMYVCACYGAFCNLCVHFV